MDSVSLIKRASIAAGLCALLSFAGRAQAQATYQSTVYSNVTTFSGSAYVNGGATTGNLATTMVADDINLASGYGAVNVTGFRFSMANLNTTALSARPIVTFYAEDGTGGGPGTYLGGVLFNAVTVSASSVTLLTYSPGTTIFTTPTSGSFWAAVSFDAGGTSTATTAAALNNFGQGLYNAPTIGSSQDVFFKSTNAGVAGSTGPAGSFLYFGGSPVANFGWAFTATFTAPEPPSGLLTLVGFGLSFGVYGLRRRRR